MGLVEALDRQFSKVKRPIGDAHWSSILLELSQILGLPNLVLYFYLRTIITAALKYYIFH